MADRSCIRRRQWSGHLELRTFGVEPGFRAQLLDHGRGHRQCRNLWHQWVSELHVLCGSDCYHGCGQCHQHDGSHAQWLGQCPGRYRHGEVLLLDDVVARDELVACGGTLIAASPSTASGSSSTVESVVLSSLTANTTYYSNLEATSSGGTIYYGTPTSFTTAVTVTKSAAGTYTLTVPAHVTSFGFTLNGAGGGGGANGSTGYGAGAAGGTVTGIVAPSPTVRRRPSSPVRSRWRWRPWCQWQSRDWWRGGGAGVKMGLCGRWGRWSGL